MNIAIYSRKSKFSEKGESVENQIQYCKAYADTHLINIPEKIFFTYEDEGFSAATSMRPQFQKLLMDIKNGKIQLLMCYRLDRITRKVSDFSKTLELLEKMNVGFISATENFDTSTPMGKAMIYIASVFAQLERETIAERVRDNMLALSKTGRWLGGLTPLGFSSSEVIYLDSEFRERKLYQLVPREEELRTVSLLFKKYLEVGSLSAVESYCLTHDIKTQKNCFFNKSSIAQILENPTYCMGDETSYHYFSELGCCVTSSKNEFDGSKGILCYNRTNQQTKSCRKRRPPDQWIVALGKHKGIITGESYVKVQKKLKQNKEKASPRKDTSSFSLVSGKIKCQNCGSKMRIKNIRNSNGCTHFSYACEMKVLSKGSKCTISNINGKEFDKALTNVLWSYLEDSVDYRKILKFLEQKNIPAVFEVSGNTTAPAALKEEKEEYRNEINTIIEQLSKDSSPILKKYLLPRLEELDRRISLLDQKIAKLSYSSGGNGQIEGSPFFIHNKEKLSSILDKANINSKKMVINAMLDSVEWNGKAAYISFRTPDI
ncbi:recombinase family protein [Anaerocolumna jejuensis]|uniref:recombinase family protein n=1 Tax=Anaerocolumna jejuensis TaxID=259063 RepID=UPI003F7C2507